MENLRRLRDRFTRSGTPDRLIPSAGPRTSRAAVLLDSGIFDLEFYSAATGIEFDSALAGARHCVRTGLPKSLSPNPLLDIASVPRAIQDAWRAGKIGVLLRYLRFTTADRLPIGPLFDGVRALGSPEEKAAHPGGALGLFLQTAAPGTVLPVPETFTARPPTLGEAREALVARVRETATQGRLTGPRVTGSWDAEEEQAWKAAWGSIDLTTGPAPLVSVITPVRNRPEMIVQAIRSVQQQTLADWEMLVVDDGSTDQTAAEVARIAQTDPRVRLLRMTHGGVSAARNRGLEAAQGEYVAFLDSDNSWRDDFLAVAIAAMQAKGLDAAYAAARLFEHSTGKVTYRAHQGGLDDLLVKNHIDLNTLLVRTDLARKAGGFDVTLRRWVDHDFALRIAARTELELLPFIACDYDDDKGASDRITNTEHESWQWVALGKNWVDWDRLVSEADERHPDLISVVIPTYQDWRMTSRAVSAVLEDADRGCIPVEVILVDNGSHREVGTQLIAAYLTEPRVRYKRLPRNMNFAIGCNVGFALSRGRRVVYLNNDTVPWPGWLTASIPHLSDPTVRGVQPLLLYPDDTIQTAGTVFAAAGFLPTHFLVGHPPEDAERLANRRFKAVTAAALAMRAEEFAALKGFDPIYVNGMEDVDLCLRAIDRFGGAFVVEPTARVMHLESKTPGRGAMISPNRQRFVERWRDRLPTPDAAERYAALGFSTAHLAADASEIPAARPVVVRRAWEVSEHPPRLRWGIKLPSIPGPRGDAWGDTHFANSLAAGLRKLGQEVVTYRHGAHVCSTSHFDDIVLGIRGLDVIVPQPGKVNIVWVISHPDDVSPEELRPFDLVYAASETWSDHMSRLTGRPVLPLHQAVDDKNLSAPEVSVGEGQQPVFVGATHPGRHRQAVLDAVAANVGLAIHGHGWEGTPAAANVASEFVPNNEVPGLYRKHGLVLADHWPDMARQGFIANRVFDAVAAGARVISDDVPGVESLFGGAVRVYRSVEHLRYLCSPEGLRTFPSAERLAAISVSVARDHSFERRAEVLLEDAVRAVRRRTKDGASSARERSEV